MQNVFRWIGIAVMLIALLILAGCAGGGGSGDDYAARLRGDTSTNTAQAAPQPTETPDFNNAQPALQPATVIVEVTRETVREVPATVEVQIEVTREVVQVQQIEVTSTPQPVPTCDPRTPAPTIALDATDVASGVVLRGQWSCWEVK